MHALHRDLENIVKIAYLICNGGYYNAKKGYERALVSSLREILDLYGLILPIDKEEIRQEVSLSYLKYKTDFRNNSPKASIRSYIISRTIWNIRDWITKQFSLTYIPYDFVLFSQRQEEKKDSINIAFLLKGDESFPFSQLNAYDRYILYLKYSAEMSLKDIAVLLGKSRPTVRKHVRLTIDKLGGIHGTNK